MVLGDCATIIDLAHGAGFDTIAVCVLLDTAEITSWSECLSLPWDERWTVSNDRNAHPDGQIDALGHDLWTWIVVAIERR
jgi:hypothetical protein